MFALTIQLAKFVSSLFTHQRESRSPENSEIDNLPDTVRADFKSASAHVRTVSGRLADDDLLYLYGRYKRVVAGANNTARPSMLSVAERAKWQSWMDVSSFSALQCAQEYIDFVVKLDCGWQRGQAEKNNAGFGVRPSRMIIDNGDAVASCSSNASWFDAVKDGDVDTVRQRLEKASDEQRALLLRDCDNALTTLHWASDRGHVEIVRLLLQFGAPYDAQSDIGQTPLHMAVANDQIECARLLLDAGADAYLCDADELRPKDYCDSDGMRLLLAQYCDT